jgi:predicted membrane channel-forming protein YqfA (hemolysin III family)
MEEKRVNLLSSWGRQLDFSAIVQLILSSYTLPFKTTPFTKHCLWKQFDVSIKGVP